MDNEVENWIEVKAYHLRDIKSTVYIKIYIADWTRKWTRNKIKMGYRKNKKSGSQRKSGMGGVKDLIKDAVHLSTKTRTGSWEDERNQRNRLQAKWKIFHLNRILRRGKEKCVTDIILQKRWNIHQHLKRIPIYRLIHSLALRPWRWIRKICQTSGTIFTQHILRT